MSTAGLGYDLAATTFSPEGRIFQVEYAAKAVDTGRTCIGLRTKNGIVLAAERLVPSPLVVPGSSKRIANVDFHVGMVSSGHEPDGRQLLNRAREEAKNYKKFTGQDISPKVLAERLGLFVQAYTLYSSVRPFGSSVLLAGKDINGYGLYIVDPSGQHLACFGWVVGKGRQAAKTELEKLDRSNLDILEAVKEVARILYATLEESPDKRVELEMSWICPQSDDKHEPVPRDIVDRAETYAKQSLIDSMEY